MILLAFCLQIKCYRGNCSIVLVYQIQFLVPGCNFFEICFKIKNSTNQKYAITGKK